MSINIIITGLQSMLAGSKKIDLHEFKTNLLFF